MLKKRGNRVNYIYIPLWLWITVEVFLLVNNFDNLKIRIMISSVISFVIIYLLYLLFCAISKSTFRGTIITLSVLLLLLVVNQVKISYSSEPLYVKDFKFLNSPSTLGGIVDGTLMPILSAMKKRIFVFVVLAVAACFVAKKFEQKYECLKKRLILLGSVIAVFTIMFLPIRFLNDIIIKTFFEVTYEKNNNPTSYVSYYNRHGVFAGMYGQYLTTILREPKGYKSSDVEEMLDEAKDTVTVENKNFKKPNIVMVFSESFWDVDKQDSVKFDKKITENYNELKSKGMYIDMISPVFGGISCNTEFEMLTGGTLTYYPECYIPYMDLYDADGYEDAPTIIKELKNNGYETNIVSPWSSSLFNCSKVYDYFDVDKVTYDSDLKNIKNKGGRVSDDYLADTIIDTLKNKDKSKPLFHLTLTAEAHMPFNENKFDNYDINVESSTLDKEETGIMKSYAQGIYDADKMLKKLYDYIQTFDEPTMLIFYGDHLPFLKTSKDKNLYDDMQYFNTGDSTMDTFRQYNTGCLILDNYNVEYEKKEYMSPYLVMPYVLNHMDINVSPFYKWVYNTIDSYPANNFFVSVNSKKEIVPTNSLQDDETKKCSEKLAKMNYYMFVDKPKR